MKHAVLLLPKWSRDQIYREDLLARIRSLARLTDGSEMIGNLASLKPVLADTEIILSGWGMIPLSKDFLDAAPRLEAVLYGAGSVRGFVTDEFWHRGILLTSAWAANAIPVVEFTIAAMVFGLKRVLVASAMTCRERTFTAPPDTNGMYGAQIGVIGAGLVGAGVLERLKTFEVQTYCYDPHLSRERARELHTTPMGLEEMFRACDAVSLHAASLPTTEHMIRGEHLHSMKQGAVFINTARGRIVKEDEMIAALLDRPDLFAFIDVTDPAEPPEPSSPLYTLPNVLLTPHLAGPRGEEIRRQGEYVLEELRRFLNREPPRYPVTKDMMEWMA